jgi:hypothetical protein
MKDPELNDSKLGSNLICFCLRFLRTRIIILDAFAARRVFRECRPSLSLSFFHCTPAEVGFK